MNAIAVDTSAAPILRPMREADLPAVMAIEQRAYAFPWTQGVFRDCLLANHPAWVLVEDGHVIGYAVLSVAADEAHSASSHAMNNPRWRWMKGHRPRRRS